jgi:hypothetical protein
MDKQIIIKMNNSAIIQQGKTASAVQIDISTNCDPNDVRMMCAVLMNWYMQNSPGPNPEPVDINKKPTMNLGGENG